MVPQQGWTPRPTDSHIYLQAADEKMASSDVVQFAGCCCSKCIHCLFNTELGISNRKYPQAKIISAKSR